MSSTFKGIVMTTSMQTVGRTRPLLAALPQRHLPLPTRLADCDAADSPRGPGRDPRLPGALPVDPATVFGCVDWFLYPDPKDQRAAG